MKTLNIEALAATNRTLTIGGKEYPVVEMTVENFIETTKAAEKLGTNPTYMEQVEATIEMIMRSVPSLSREVLLKLSLEHLSTIVKFIRGDMDEQAQPAQAEGNTEGK